MFLKDIAEVSQQVVEELAAGGDRAQLKVVLGRTNAAPAHDMVSTPELHGERLEIPKNRAQSAQPVHTQDQIEASEQNHVEVEDECFVVNGDDLALRNTCDANPFAVSDCYMEAQAWCDRESQPARYGFVDEGVGRPAINQRRECMLGDSGLEAHGVSRADPC